MATTIDKKYKMENKMTTKPQYNHSTVFETSIDWDFGKIFVTPRMLGVLAHIDGKRSLAEIEELFNISNAHLFGDIQRLHELELIKTCVPDHLIPLQAIKSEVYRESSQQTMAV